MKIVPSKDFHYALDGIRPTLFKKGVEAYVPDQVAEELQKSGGYIDGYDVKAEKQFKGTDIPLSSIKEIKPRIVSVLADAGIVTLRQLKESDVDMLSAIDGISPKVAEELCNFEFKA